MPKNVVVYDLLISCPSDVVDFIPKIEFAVDFFNNHYGRLNDTIIRTIHWLKNSYPTMGNSPQEILDTMIVDEADLVVGIFWTKFGMPTETHESGSEEEIERMIADGKQVFLYFLNKALPPSEINYEQYMKVLEFKKRHEKSGIYFEISDENQLAQKFCEHLELYFGGKIYGPAFKAHNSKREILWVDDKPENNTYERNMLEQYGLEFTLALTTQQAMQYLHHQKFSLIISDMGRKEGPREGYVLLEQVRKIDKDIPFIIYSVSREQKHIQEAITRGGQGCTNDSSELVDLVIKNLL